MHVVLIRTYCFYSQFETPFLPSLPLSPLSSVSQVSTWFANGRRRLKKATQEEEEKQSYGSSSGISSNGTSSSQPCAGPNSPRSSNSVTNSNEVEGKFHNNYDSKAPTKHVAEGKKSCYTKIGGHRSL